MRLWKLLLLGMIVPGAAFAWPWSQDMMNQPSIKPQEGKEATRPFAARSVPITGIPTQIHNRDEAKNLTNPIPATEESLKKGRTLFRIYCAACHGLNGGANSPISPKIGAINLREDYAQKQLTEGWIFGTITFGSAIMPAYGDPMGRDDKRGSNDLSVEERWHVVNYVKRGLLSEPEMPEVHSAQGQ